MRLLLAIKAFFQVLTNAQVADEFRRILDGGAAPTEPAVEAPAKPEPTKPNVS